MMRGGFAIAAFAAALLLGMGGQNRVEAHPASEHQPASMSIYVLELDEKALRENSRRPEAASEALALAIEVISSRLRFGPNSEAEVRDTEDGQIMIRIPGDHDRELLFEYLATGADLEFGLVLEEPFAPDAQQPDLEQDVRLFPSPDGYPPMQVKITEGLGGRQISYAGASIDEQTGEPVINLTFDEEGKRLFGQLSAANVGRKIAVILDGQVVTAPYVNEPILGGQVQISGRFTQESAERLAAILRSGALPVPLKLVEERVLN